MRNFFFIFASISCFNLIGQNFFPKVEDSKLLIGTWRLASVQTTDFYYWYSPNADSTYLASNRYFQFNQDGNVKKIIGDSIVTGQWKLSRNNELKIKYSHGQKLKTFFSFSHENTGISKLYLTDYSDLKENPSYQNSHRGINYSTYKKMNNDPPNSSLIDTLSAKLLYDSLIMEMNRPQYSEINSYNIYPFNNRLIKLSRKINILHPFRYWETYNILAFENASSNSMNNLRIAFDLSPTEPSLFYTSYSIYRYILNDLEQALHSLNWGLILYPEDMNLRLARAQFLYNQYKLKPAALRDINKVIKDHPKDAVGYYFRAALSFGDTSSLINDLNKCIELDSLNSNYYFERGCLRIKIGQDTLLAKKDFLESLRLGYTGWTSKMSDAGLSYELWQNGTYTPEIPKTWGTRKKWRPRHFK